MGGNLGYKNSELCAIEHGFEEFSDEKAYNGRYFLKAGLIWIHDIDALMKTSGLDEEGLKKDGYDVDTYHSRNCGTSS